MKKKLFFSICLVLSILGILFAVLYNIHLTQKGDGRFSAPGLLEIEQPENPMDMNIPLIGEWEYYDNTFIKSGDEISALPGVVGSRVPDFINGLPSETEEPVIDLSVHPEVEHRKLPDTSGGLANLFSYQHTRGSYRLIIRGCYMTPTDDPLFLCLCGNVTGNYSVYVNGELKRTRMTSPWGYPIYLLERGAEENEVVIEVSNNSGFLNVTPYLMSVAESMTFFDVHKNISMIVASVLIAVFILLFFTILSSKNKELSGCLIFGILSTLFYILFIIWSSGFIDSVTKVIPNFLLHLLATILLAGEIIVVFYALRRIIPKHYKNKHFLFCILLAIAGTILNAFYLFPGYSALYALIGDICFAALIIYWCVMIFRHVNEIDEADMLLFSGSAIVFGGNVIVMIADSIGLSRWIYIAMPISIAFFAVLLFIVLWRKQTMQVQQAEATLALEKENLKMQTALYSSQINPHFLYNTLMTIQEMCYTEPKEAAHLIVVFSKYLRNNIDFMESSDLISFRNELSHIDTYIYVQKARFGDKLKFEKLIKAEDFLLPPLSVQPIVENAVQYGVRSREEGGIVTLRTFEDEELIHIIVENDGPGFDPEKAGATHSLANIKRRLKSLVNGEMVITSAGPDIPGVKVEITIPSQNIFSETKKANQEEQTVRSVPAVPGEMS